MMRFQNPANGYVEEVRNPRVFTALFGFFYFAVKGVWTHAIASLVLAFFTFGVSWLVYPTYAEAAIRTHYLRHLHLRRGWIEVRNEPALPAGVRGGRWASLW
jgi:hypothetical protein